MLNVHTCLALTSWAIAFTHHPEVPKTNEAFHRLKWRNASLLKKCLFRRRPPLNHQHDPHDIDVSMARQFTAWGLHYSRGGRQPEHCLRWQSAVRHSLGTRVEITQSSWRAWRYCFRLRLSKHSALLRQAATSVSANEGYRLSVFPCVLWKFFGFLLDLVYYLLDTSILQNRLFASVVAQGQHELNIFFSFSKSMCNYSLKRARSEVYKCKSVVWTWYSDNGFPALSVSCKIFTI